MIIQKYITKDLLERFIKSNRIFENEYDFQFEFAYFLRKECKNLDIKVEQRIYKKDDKYSHCRCDIVGFDKNNAILLVELKYVLENQTSCGARASFIKDIQRLKKLEGYKNSEKCCIFVSNKPAVINNTIKAKDETGIFNLCNKKIWNWKPVEFKDKKEISYIFINPDEWIEPQKDN